jgi:hypothetical protein
MKRLLFVPIALMLGGCAVSTATHDVTPPAGPTRHVTAASTPATPSPTDRVIASREGRIDGESVRLAITQLVRTGSTTSLGIRLTTNSGFDASVREALDDGATQPIRGSDSQENGTSVDGIYLIERTHAQKYLVARDPDDRCICDTGLSDARFNGGAPLNLSATFAAPPPSVQAVDVVVPRFGTFANVPLG